MYYHRDDGYGESLQIFLRHNDLPQRWRRQSRCVIGEIGFGAGLRFLSTWQCWRQQGLPARHRLHFISVERRPLRPKDLRRAHRQWPQLSDLSAALAAQYPPPLPGFHRLHFDDNVTLTLLWGEATERWAQVDGQVDAWFCDGFAPRRNPAAWSAQLFETMAAHSHPGTTLATYSGSREVQAQLTDAGFAVKRQAGFAGKKYLLCGRYVGTANRTSSAVVDEKTRIAVIGAGLAGCHVASALARRRLTCTVFDAAPQVAAGASGNPRALVNGRLSPAWSVNDEYYTCGALYARRQLVCAPAAVAWRPDGMLYLAADATRRQRLERLLSRRQFESDCVSWSDRKTVAERTGLDLACEGLWLPWASTVDPTAWCRYLLSDIDIELRLGRAVRTLQQSHGGWQVTLADGDHTLFDVVIVAAAYHALAVLPSPWRSLPLKPRPGQISIVPAVDDAPPFTALHDGGYLLPPANGLCYAGATYRRDPTRLTYSTADDRDNIGRWTDLHDALAARLAQPPLPGRVGVRAVTPDRLPLLGALGDPSLLLNAGHGSHGAASTPLAAEILTCRLTGEPSPVAARVAAAVSPGRFFERALLLSR